jgi:iron complex transport system substrate-binding protein
METRLPVVLAVLLLLAVWGHHALRRVSSPSPVPVAAERIVSLAPSVTEILYTLGLGSRLVGVTRFCSYPPDVVNKARVAGFTDVNYEAVLRVRPDLVILPADKTDNRVRLERLGLAVLPLDIRTLAGVMDSMTLIGRRVGRREEARAARDVLLAGLEAARTRAAGRTSPRVLFSVMHAERGLEAVTEINAVGRDGFYSELIRAAGGRNVYEGGLAFPRLSREALIFLDPEVIIDVIPDGRDREAILRKWQNLVSVSAVRNGRIHLFTDVADTVPGPRSYLTLGKLSRAFHPEGP